MSAARNFLGSFGLRSFALLCHAALILRLLVASAAAQNSLPREFRSKANFLTNFPSFVEWPESTFASPQAPVTICVSGDFSFGTVLAEAARGASPHGRRIEIRWARKNEDLRTCQIIFVSRSESKRYSKLLEAISRDGVLTVGESPDFLAAGGMITFDFQGEILQFEVNLQAAQSAHLKISSRLLALARRVVLKNDGDKS